MCAMTLLKRSPLSPTIKGFFDLDPYQHGAIDFAHVNPACALWIDLGLGKTVITLSVIKRLIEEREAKRVLVIGPLRVVRKGWPDEVADWSHLRALTIASCTGSQADRLYGLRTDAHIHTINFNNLPWLLKLFYRVDRKPNGDKHITQIRKVPWDMIVVDEAVSLQDPSGAWYNAVKYLRRGVPRFIELTGDPIPQGYMSLFTQMYLLDQGKRLGPNITTYRKTFFDYNQPAGTYDIQETAPARIQKAVSDITLTLREEDHLLGLPPYPKPTFIRCDLTKPEMKKYKEMQRQYVMELDGQEITAVNAGVVWGKLLQLSNGSVWVDEKTWLPFHDHKLEQLESYLPMVKGPVLLFYLFKPDLARVTALLTRMGKRWKLLSSEQDEDDFNDDKLDVLVLHPLSGGHGLNLHYGSAETIIWFGLTPSAGLYKQANARLFGGRRRLKKPNGVIAHIVANNTQDFVVVDNIERNTFNSESMKEAMVRLHRELRQ
jgi:SNF2 family DNA or RNA helicase